MTDIKTAVMTAVALLASAGVTIAAERGRPVVVTASNEVANRLLVYDTAGTLIDSVPTLGQGGVDGNAGGIATSEEKIAVVNFGSQNLSIFAQQDGQFILSQLIPTASRQVSVAFGKDRLYVLGTTAVESHRLGEAGVDASADGTVVLAAADASAAQVGVVGDRLVITEKSGTIELVQLRDGAVDGAATTVPLPADSRDTPFGLVTHGSNAYVTIAHSDLVGVINAGRLTSLAATGVLNGSGQHSPCWIALVGPYLFTANSPSKSISRLIAAGRSVILDQPVAGQTTGAPIDIAADGDLLAVVETNDGGGSHLTQFHIDDDGNLTPVVSAAIASTANGVAIVPAR